MNKYRKTAYNMLVALTTGSGLFKNLIEDRTGIAWAYELPIDWNGENEWLDEMEQLLRECYQEAK